MAGARCAVPRLANICPRSYAMATEHIAFFGRSGVGTTTVITNLAAALAEAGQRVVLVGCGARANTTAWLRPGKILQPLFSATGRELSVHRDAVGIGFKGVLCLEAGTPDASGFNALPDLIERSVTTVSAMPEVVLYDLSGEGSALQLFIASGKLQAIVAVTSAEVDTLQTVNELYRLVLNTGNDSLVAAGVVGNNLTALYAERILSDFAHQTASAILATIPRSLVATRSAFFGETVIDAAPLSHQAYFYRKLARRIATRPATGPIPLTPEAFNDWALEWGDRLYDYGEGLVSGGEAI